MRWVLLTLLVGCCPTKPYTGDIDCISRETQMIDNYLELSKQLREHEEFENQKGRRWIRL